jgi:hypothetical protein
MSFLGAAIYYRPKPDDGFTGHQGGFCTGIVCADVGEGKVNLSVFIHPEGPIHEGHCVLRQPWSTPVAHEEPLTTHPEATADSTPAEDESQDSNEASNESSPASVGAMGDDQGPTIHS